MLSKCMFAGTSCTSCSRPSKLYPYTQFKLWIHVTTKTPSLYTTTCSEISVECICGRRLNLGRIEQASDVEVVWTDNSSRTSPKDQGQSYTVTAEGTDLSTDVLSIDGTFTRTSLCSIHLELAVQSTKVP